MLKTGSVILLLVILSISLGNGLELASPEIAGPSGVACAQPGKCVAKADGVMFASAKTNGYVVCQCECEIERPCPIGTKFDKKQLTCARVNEGVNGGTTGPSGVTCVQRGRCAGKPDGTMFASSKGNGYIVCQCECEIEMPCAPGTKFDENQRTCVHLNEGGNENGGNGGQVSCPSGVTCTKPGLCTGKADGTIFADSKSNGYIVCECECEIKKTCPVGSKFNEQSMKCEPEDCGVSCPSGVTCTKPGQCAGKADGTIFADSKSNGYIVCECECEIKKTCPVGSMFDEQLLICVNEGGNGGTTGPSGVTCVQRGRCAGKPDGTMFASSKGNGYIVCQCECEIEMPCAPGTKFDENQRTCVHLNEGGNENGGNGGQVSCPSGVTCTKPGKCAGKADGTIFADSKSNGYIICECECEIKKTCPVGSKFNEQLLKCEPEDSGVSCPSGVTCTKPGQCAGKADGTIFADSKSNGYIVCECECEIKKTCPVGSKFNEQLLKCEPKDSGVSCPSGVTCTKPGKCAGKADGTIFADSKSNGYIVCECECEIKKTCPVGSMFDEQLLICVNEGGNGGSTGPSGVTCVQSGKCAGKPDGTMFASSKGNGYIVCQCECEIEMPCAAGTKFNEKQQICEAVNEGGNNNGNVICNNDVKLCNNQPEGTLFPVDGVCNKFYKCNYGCAVEINCPNNLVYNPTTEYCDYPQNYNCPWPYQPPSGPSAGPSGIACANGGRCVGQAEGTHFPSLNSCSKYVICQCECEVEMNCSKGLYWDQTNLTCNYAANVKCTLA